MADEVLRLRTIVVPDNNGMRQVQQNVQQLGRTAQGVFQQVKTSSDTVARSFQQMNREAASAGMAVGRAFGALGVSLTIGALAQKLNQVSKEMIDLSYASREMGMSERHVRAFMNLAEKSGVSGEAMAGTLKNVRREMAGLNYAGSQFRANLIEQVNGGRALAAQLMAIQDPGERTIELYRTLNALMAAGNERAAELIAGFAGIPLDQLRLDMKKFNEEFGKLPGITKEQEEAAKKLRSMQVDLNETTNEFARNSLPPLVGAMNTIVGLFNSASAATDKWRESLKAGEAAAGTETAVPGGQSVLGAGIRGLFGGGGTAPPGTPKFQTGGIVTGTGLAVVHAGERVLPATGSGFGMPDLRGAAGEDRLQDEETTEEGTFKALVRFDSYLKMGKNLGGGGGPGVGGAGGGAGGGSGLGGGEGGSQPAGSRTGDDRPDSSTVTPSADEKFTAAAAKGQFPMGTQPIYGGAGGLSIKPGESPAGAVLPGGGGGGGLNVEAFNKTFKGTPLEGKAEAVAAAAKEHGIPPNVLAGVMAHETNQGKSKMIRDKLNPGGLMTKGGAGTTGQTFKSIEEGISATAKSFGRHWQAQGGDINKVAEKWAPTKNATNDPGRQNKSWPGGVAGFAKKFEGTGTSEGTRQDTSTVDDGGKTKADGGSGATHKGAQGAAQALAIAKQHLGEHEIKDRSKLMSFFKEKGIRFDPSAASWCGVFVQRSLAGAGIQGPKNYPAAGAFVGYGTSVSGKDVQAGDIGVVRGRSPRTGIEGKHVGFLTGRTKMEGGRLKVEMLSGNDNDQVQYSWRDASSLHMRRPPAATGQGDLPTYAQTPIPQGDLPTKPKMGDASAIDRANGAQIAAPQSTINLDVRHDGSRASAKVAGSKGPAFADTKIKNQTQMQPTADYGRTAEP